MGGFVNIVKNTISILGDVIWAAFQQLGAYIRPVTDKLVEIIFTAGILVKDGLEAAKNFMTNFEQDQKTVAEMAAEPWERLKESIKEYRWLPKGTKLTFDDLRVNLEESLAKAEKSAAAVGAAAVSIAAGAAAKETTDEVKSAVRAAKTDFLSGDTYRAATMSIRADYAKGEDRTVKAIDRVKSINEKIQKACEDTASALANVEVMA